MNSSQVLAWADRVKPKDETSSSFPQGTPLIIRDYTKVGIRRAKDGKLIVPSHRSPAFKKPVEKLMVLYDFQHGGEKRLRLSEDGRLRLHPVNSMVPGSKRELFFIRARRGYMVFGSLHQRSLVVAHNEVLCRSSRSSKTDLTSIANEFKFYWSPPDAWDTLVPLAPFYL